MFMINLFSAVNPCAEDPNPCHPMAVCIQSGAGAFQCKCQWGYDGDGFICTPIDPCQINFGSCPDDTTRCVYDKPGIVSSSCFVLLVAIYFLTLLSFDMS